MKKLFVRSVNDDRLQPRSNMASLPRDLVAIIAVANGLGSNLNAVRHNFDPTEVVISYRPNLCLRRGPALTEQQVYGA